uniref:Uncharacterized protein n=1 Tax=Romanomermis culicivorax TaxID=13658 RepID=A0A915KNW5_ROMCU
MNYILYCNFAFFSTAKLLMNCKTKLTFLKCVADCTFLTGCINASRTRTEISAPEYLKI